MTQIEPIFTYFKFVSPVFIIKPFIHIAIHIDS